MSDKKVKIINIKGEVNGETIFPKDLIVDHPNQHVVFEQVVAENNSKRQGTHSTLKKGEVRGGGRKPRPQKHTGNARQGSTRNPHWVGGGVVFGPKPTRNYKLYLNKKSCNLAFKSALTYGLNDGKIYFLEGASEIKKPSTKTIASMLKKLNLNGNYLFISNDNKLLRSANNIEDSICRLIKEVSVYDLLNANNIIIQNEQVNLLQERVKK